MSSEDSDGKVHADAKGMFSRAADAAKKGVDQVKAKYEEAGGTERAKEIASQAVGSAKKGIDAAKVKYDEAGGNERVKSEVRSTLECIKSGFQSDTDKTGFKAFLSRFLNLWKSGLVGKISLIVSALLILGIVKTMVSPNEVPEMQKDAAASGNYGQPSYGASAPAKQGPKQTLFMCSECGTVVARNSPAAPGANGCNVDKHQNHRWKTLGRAGDFTFHCSKCGSTVNMETRSGPNRNGCPRAHSHDWKSL